MQTKTEVPEMTLRLRERARARWLRAEVYARDLRIPCPATHAKNLEATSDGGKTITGEHGCTASVGEPCVGLPSGTVHFGRRLKRLLAGIRGPDGGM